MKMVLRLPEMATEEENETNEEDDKEEGNGGE